MRLLFFVIMVLVSLSNPLSGKGAEFGDIDLSVYMLGSWPRDQDIYTQGMTVPASIQKGIGAGLKVGLFPHFTKRVIGIELDSSIHGGALSFPSTAIGQNNGTGRSDVLILNTMFNLILRYPGEMVTPYVGVGAGWSQGTLLNPNIAGRADQDFDSARTLGYQYLAGVKAMVSPKVFLFGEYRYFSANYHWEGLAVNFRAHYGLFGIGLHF
ncbi:MAG: porin family protein [Nitrospira sp.]|nr:porin family protein [Nitrospira sp.]